MDTPPPVLKLIQVKPTKLAGKLRALKLHNEQLTDSPERGTQVQKSRPLELVESERLTRCLRSKMVRNQSTAQIESRKTAKGKKFKQNLFLKKSQSLYTLKAKSSGHRFDITDFVELAELGRGSFGTVKLCLEKKTYFAVAIKAISKAKIKQFGLVEQLINQIKIHSTSVHQNILQLYGWFSDEIHFYLILELAPTSLYSLLRQKGNFGCADTLQFVKQVAKALHYLHSKDIIHRDVKPQNIMYIFGKLKLSDFGWSTTESTNRTTFCGTLDYVSPEIMARKHYSAKVDIWSLGVLCFQLRSGQTPFKRQRNLQQFMCKLRGEQVQMPEYFQEQIRGVVEGCLRVQAGVRASLSSIIG